MLSSEKRRPFKGFSEFERESVLAHELPYRDFLEGIVVLADGTLAAGAGLKGLATEGKDPMEINQMAQALRSILNSLPDGWEFSFVVDNHSNFSEQTQRHLDIAKDASDNIQWLTSSRVANLSDLAAKELILRRDLSVYVYRRFGTVDQDRPRGFANFFKAPQKFQDVQEGKHKKMAKEIDQVLNSLCDQLSGLGVSSNRLTYNEIVGKIFGFLNPGAGKDTVKASIGRVFEEQEFTPEEIQKEPRLALSTPREQLVQSDVVRSYDTLYYDGFYPVSYTHLTLPTIYSV